MKNLNFLNARASATNYKTAKADQSFLKENSGKYYQEYDTINKELTDIRQQLKDEEENLGLADRLSDEHSSVLEIDAEDGTANHLNILTIQVCQLVNSRLFNKLIKHKLSTNDKGQFSFKQIPLETDAIMFMSNPLSCFDLLVDIMSYRENKSVYIRMYINNRVTRWLFRFTQFMLSFDKLKVMAELSFLRPKRFEPYKGVFLKTITNLCAEAKNAVLDHDKPIFTNDLRRLYIILTRVMILAGTKGIEAPEEVKKALVELIPEIDLNLKTLQKDKIIDDFVSYHYNSSGKEKQFFAEYSQMQKQDIKHTFEFFGHLHPTDRYHTLKALYVRSKSHLIKLFLKIKHTFLKNPDSPQFYETIAYDIASIVNYKDVVDCKSVDKTLIEKAFTNKKLILDIREPELEVKDVLREKENPLATQTKYLDSIFEQRDQLFKHLIKGGSTKNPEIAKDIATLGFIYFTIEFGKPVFNTFCLLDILMLKINPNGLKAILKYLLNTGQLTEKFYAELLKNLEGILLYYQKLIETQKRPHNNLKLFDDKNNLLFNDLKTALDHSAYKNENILKKFRTKVIQLNFLQETLTEYYRYLSRKENTPILEINSDHLKKFLLLPEFMAVLNDVNIQVKNNHPKLFDLSLSSENSLKRQLLELIDLQESITLFERTRFLAPSKADQENAGLDISDEVKKTLLPFMLVVANKHNAFNSLKKDEDKSNAFFELGRTPFNYIIEEFNNPVEHVFVLAEVFAINMDGQSRKKILEFLFKSGQLNVEEARLIQSNMVKFLIYFKQIFQRVDWGGHYLLWKKNYGKIDFSQLARLQQTTDRVLKKQLPKLFLFKEQSHLLIEGLAEVERALAIMLNKSHRNVTTEEIIDALENPTKDHALLTQLKKSVFGRKYLGKVAANLEVIGLLRKRLIEQYKTKLKIISLSRWLNSTQKH